MMRPNPYILTALPALCIYRDNRWGWSRVVCFWWLLLFLAPDDDLAAAEEAASTAAPGEATGLLHIHHHYHHQPSSFSSSSSYRWTGAGGRRYGAYAPTSAETASLSVPPPPRALVRKILFHLALFLSVAVDLPAWSVLVYSSITDDTLFDGSETSNPVKWPKADPAPVLLYLLHLSTYFFLFLAMAIVLNMWLTVAEFDPRKHLRIWRGFAVVALITFIVLWAWVVVEVSQSAMVV